MANSPVKRLYTAVRKGLGYPLPSSGGSIPFDWPTNWFQTGHNPQGNGSNVTAQACIAAYAETMAILWPYQYAVSSSDEKTKVRSSSAARTLRNPNPYQTRSDFMLNLVTNLLSDGNAYAVGYRDDRNQITQMHLLPPRSTTPYVDPETKAVFYAAGDNPLIASETSFLIPARDVLHVKLHTPRHPLVGVSPIVNLAMAMASNNAITAHQAQFFNNMRRPSGVLSSDMELTVDQMAQLRTAWDAQSKDLNSGGVPILGMGMKWQPMSISSQDAELAKAFNMGVEDIARAFRVPLPLVGDLRYGTYNNTETLLSMWLATGLGFVLEHVELSFDKFFEMADNQTIEFDTHSLLRSDFAGRIDGLTKGLTGGLYTPNEARQREGLPKVEYGDTPIVQQQMVPLGWTQTQAERETITAEDIEETPLQDEPEEEPDAEVEAEFTANFLRRAINNV
jgi:HK97 family phage portal protein